SYDPVGNRTSSGHQPGVWSYNGDNQLTQYPRTTPFSGAPAQNTQVTYTAQGHTQSEQSGAWQRDYRYNAAERLIETSQNGQSTSYRYDPFGRRISKTSGSGAGSTTTTYYLYSDTGLMAEADSQGNLTKAYGFNPRAQQQGLWSTDPMWQADVRANSNSLTDRATSYHYLHTDHLATPVLATDKAGEPTWKGASEALGATKPMLEATEMNLRFPGQYRDRETNSHYNFHRDYLPGVGRYMQGDSQGIDDGPNLYVYAKLNALSLGDPRGRAAVCVANPLACGAVILTGVRIIGQGCKILAVLVGIHFFNIQDERGMSEADGAQMNAEWARYHNFCDNNPPNPDSTNGFKPQSCPWAKRNKDLAEKCYDLRLSWMQKWKVFDKRHADQLATVARRIANAVDQIKNYCKEPCDECQ
ncbi:RHS repeat domain-containing protein, partial [Acidovorax sp. Leaf84]